MTLTRSIQLIMLVLLSCLFACRSDGQDRSTKPASSQVQWVDTAKLQPGPVRHEQLSAAQMERIKKLQQTFSEVDPMPLEKWVDDFKRDLNPDRELRVYEGMAEAYTAYCSGRNLTPLAKQDVYQVVLLRSSAPDAEVLQQLNLKALSIDDAKEILKLYKAPPAPIKVSPVPGGQ